VVECRGETTENARLPVMQLV